MTRSAGDRLGNLVLFLATIAVNAMATSIPLGGRTPKEISDSYPSLFTPASFTFSIWAVIYTGLTLYVIYQALPAQKNNPSLGRIDHLFKLNCVGNSAWILAWHYDFLLLSLLLMAGILASLIGIYRILRKDYAAAPLQEKIVLHLPFSLYTAWISVASIANLSTVQTAMAMDDLGMTAISWTVLKLALAGCVAAMVLLRKSDIPFALVIAWAAYGISANQVATPAVYGAALTLCVLAVMLALLESLRLISPR